jgi:hypothetical protein
MGKKYVPVVVRGCPQKMYLEDLRQIIRRPCRTKTAIPSYQSTSILRKDSQKTQPDFDIQPEGI